MGQTYMEATGFTQLCRDTHLIDKRFTVADANLIFANTMLCGQHQMDFLQFQEAVRLIGKKKGVPPDIVLEAIVPMCRGMALATSTGVCLAGTLPLRSPSPILALSSTQEHLPKATSSRLKEPDYNTESSTGTCQKEGWIGEAFKVFCGNNQAMDSDGFVKFCRGCKFTATDPLLVFSEISSHKGMNFVQFKAALRLLVENNCKHATSSSSTSNIVRVKRSLHRATKLEKRRTRSISSDTCTTCDMDLTSDVASSVPSSPPNSEARTLLTGVLMDDEDGSEGCHPHLHSHQSSKMREQVPDDRAHGQLDCLPPMRFTWTPPTLEDSRSLDCCS